MQTARIFARSTSSLASSYCRRAASKHIQQCSKQSLLAFTQMGSFPVSRCQSTSTEPIPPPSAEGAPKSYSPKIEALVDDISKLTLLEVADLNELLKKTLNIQDAPMMAMGAMPVAAAKSEEDEEEAAPKREKVSFTVKLVKFDAGKKVPLIKEIKSTIDGLNLVQAKKFVESIPQIVKADIPKEEAEKLKEALAAVGGEVEID